MTAILIRQNTVETTIDLVRQDAPITMPEIDPQSNIHAKSDGVAVTLEVVADQENGNNRATTANCGATIAK
jgi:hypothetical protein